MNAASRVARPTTSGNTPVASGSSVPVWPIRSMPSARRTTATTSCEVGPAGLSMTRTPSLGTRHPALPVGDRGHQAGDDLRPYVGERSGHRESRCVLVSAAAVLVGHQADVDVVLRP